MNPTVSVTRYLRPSCSKPRVVGSSVSNRRSATGRAARVLDETVANGDVGPGECVQKLRLTGVRVAGQGHHGRLRPPPRLSASRTLPLDSAETVPEHGDPPSRATTGGPEL